MLNDKSNIADVTAQLTQSQKDALNSGITRTVIDNIGLELERLYNNFGIDSFGDSYVRFMNGIQFCWGSCVSGRNNTTWNSFPVSFKDANYAISVTTRGTDNNAENIMVAAREAGRFACRHYNSWGGLYIAVGKWR